jgi:hypothetical protein
MNLIILIITGFWVGILIGFIHEKNTNTNWIDGKKEVEDYMTKKYGKNWSTFK